MLRPSAGFLPPRCDITALRPGDIGFYYAPRAHGRHRTLKQWFIGLGQSYGRLAHPGTGGNTRVMHAYIVLRVFPLLGRAHVADAASDGKGRCGVGTSVYDFYGKGPDNPGGHHLFYRFVDSRLARAIRDRAEAWAARPARNFSNWRAATAPFRIWALLCGARRHIRHLVGNPPRPRQVPMLNGRGAYPLMCSNFVASVCVPEVLDLYCRDHKLPHDVSLRSLRALACGSAGSVFDTDPRWVLPATLQARLAGSRAATAVGTLHTGKPPGIRREPHRRGARRRAPGS